MKEETSMDRSLISTVCEAIENNLADENFGVDELANEVGISRSQLHRRLKILTGQSASQMIREFRLKKALEMLQNNVATASEIAYNVGFSSPSYFSTCFNEFFGYPPGKAKRNNANGITKKHTIPRKFLLISITTLLVVTFAFVLYVIFSNRNPETTPAVITNKSIAVLPFKSLSDDPEKQYQADGVMEAITLHLSKIEDLRVVDLLSVEQYRETDKTATTICQELDVAYLLTGSFQKYGDKARLMVQLIGTGMDKYIWAEDYDLSWKDIFSVQSEVAQTIASELQAVITPEEKQLIEKIPTADLTAYDFYQRGREEYEKFMLDKDNIGALEKAKNLYYKALDYDSTFAQAYTGLAWVYWHKNFWVEILTDKFLDSVIYLTDIALSFNDQLSEAYVIRGNYYEMHNQKNQAINEYDKAININPNDWQAYMQKGGLYSNVDEVIALDAYHKAASLHRGFFLPNIYTSLMFRYASTGFKEKAFNYATDAFKLNEDSALYYDNLAFLEEGIGNYEKAIEYAEKAYAIDSTRPWVIHHLGSFHSYLDQFEEYLRYFKEYERLNLPHPFVKFRIGHAYWVNGFKEKAEYYFNTGLEFYDELNELDRNYGLSNDNYFQLAFIHAFQGDKEKAFEYLGFINRVQNVPLFMISVFKNDPMLDSIRDEPEFQQFVRDVEAKLQAEHERVRKWLEGNGMI